MIRIIRRATIEGLRWAIHPDDWPSYAQRLRSRGQSLPRHGALFMGWEAWNVWDAMTDGASFGRQQVPILFGLPADEFRYV